MKRWLLNPWTILGAIAFGTALYLVTVFLIWISRPGPAMTSPSTPIMSIVAAPSDTPVPPTPSPTLTPTPISPVPPAPAEGVISVGAYVQVSGTGGDGLRMRLEPGLQGRVLFIGLEAEVFLVSGGPTLADDYTWWYLVGPYEDDRQGWAVSNYLSIVQNP